MEMWSHNVVDSMTCTGGLERRRGVEETCLARGVEKKSKVKTMTMTTLTEDVSKVSHLAPWA